MTQVTFLMDSDPTTGPGAGNQFYTIAAEYFAKHGGAVHKWAPGKHSLEEVFVVLRAATTAPDVINIVCHATGFGTMEFALTAAMLKAKPPEYLTDLHDITLALGTPPTLPALAVSGITGNSTVILYGCDIGRSIEVVKKLGVLFGNPAKIIAPRRVATFKRSSSGEAQYRLSRSWSVPSRLLPPMPTSSKSPLWSGFRTQFVNKAGLIFGSKANQVRSLGSADLEYDLNKFVVNATDSTADPSFFTEGSFGLSAAQVAAYTPASNADPAPQGIPATPQEVDDSWQVTTLTSTDDVLVPGSTTKWDISVAILASVIDVDVVFSDSQSFFTWSYGTPVAPGKPVAPVPANPPSGGGTPPGPSGDLGSLTDQLLAAGVMQAELDPLLATLVVPAAADDILLAANGDAAPDDDDDDIDQPRSLAEV